MSKGRLKDGDYLRTLSQHVRDVVNSAKLQLRDDKVTKAQRIAIERKIFAKLMLEAPMCIKCGRTSVLTLDHIVPVAYLADMGHDVLRDIVDDNYQLLCKPCNLFKADRLDFSNPKTKEILIRLLEKL